MTKAIIDENILDTKLRKKIKNLQEEVYKWCAIAIIHNQELADKIKELK
jgi:hypothetical protein